MSHEFDTATPYTASYLLLPQAEKIAFVLRKRGWMADHYGLVSGKKEKGEGFIRAGIGEGEEEAGIIILPEDMEHALTMSRYEVDSNQEWVDVFFRVNRWKGEIHNAEPSAHSELIFCYPNNPPENTVPSVRFALQAIAQGQQYVEYGWENTTSLRKS